MRAAREAIARYRADQQTRLGSRAALQADRMGHQWARHITEALAPGEAARRAMVEQAMKQWGSSTIARLTEAAQAAQARMRFDTPALDRMLGELAQWQLLDLEQRANAAHVLEESYEAAAAGTSTEVPEEMVAGLEEPARDFVSSEAGFLPAKVQRSLFIYFCGLLVIIALMQASFTSDTADAVLGKGAEYAPYAAMVMLAAGTAWDRYGRRPDDEDEDNQE
jgi:hypothetical protein